MHLAALILTGGTADRLGGADKATIEIDGTTLLEHVLVALEAAEQTVVVGPRVTTSRPVTWAREEPAGGGPVAGLVAGYRALASAPELLAVAAVDMPRLSADTFLRLARAAEGVDGAFLVSGGRRHLAGLLRPATMTWPSPEQAHGMPVHRFLQPYELAEVPAIGAEARDVDTWRDVEDLGS